ncbi:hypothetical protein RCL1_003901 [Eukaryota sp. TZLM3-RCL]
MNEDDFVASLQSQPLPFRRFAYLTDPSKDDLKISKYHDLSSSLPDFSVTSTANIEIFSQPSFDEIPLKQKIKDNYLEKSENLQPSTDDLFLLSSLSKYSDVCYIGKEHLGSSRDSLLEMTCLHVINHVISLQNRVDNHNSKLKSPEVNAFSFKDQGFSRPAVIILCPFRYNAYKTVKILTKYYPHNKEIANSSRFEEQFGVEGSQDGVGEPLAHKSIDWNTTFTGNIDDCFVLPLSFSKKQIKLFSPFSKTDVIIASPLGIQMILKKEHDAGFLSSISLFIADQCDVIFHQNWENLVEIFGKLNVLPSKIESTFDISRLWPCFQENCARLCRQVVLFSEFNFPFLQSLFKNNPNIDGKILIEKLVVPTMNLVSSSVSQSFSKISSNSKISDFDTRVKILIATVLPRLLANGQHVLLYVPDYLNFPPLREALKKEGIYYVSACEYDKKSDVDRARSNFAKEKDSILFLLSGRFYFFKRFNVIGATHVVFFAPPFYSNFYSNILNSHKDVASTVIFSKYDFLFLSRIVGLESAQAMLSSERNYFIIDS